MKKLKFFLGFALCLMFCIIPNVNADTYQLNDLEIQGYNNNGSSLTTPSEFGCSDSTCGMYITTNANSYGGAWIIESPISLVSNYTYTLTLRIRTSGTSNIVLSAKNNIAVGTSLSNAKSRYEASNFNATMNYSRASGDNTLQFVFTPTSSGSYFVVPFTTNISSKSNYFIDYLIIDNMGNNGLSQNDINNSLSNQTNEINNSINNSTNTITGSITDSQNNINSNIDDMEQSLIDSNKETQDVIKDQFNSCRDSINLLPNNGTSQTIYGITFTVNSDKSITMNGTATENANFPIFGTNWSSTNMVLNLEEGIYSTFGKGTTNAIVYLRNGIDDINVSTPLDGVRTTNSLNLITFAFIQVPKGRTVNNETIYPMLVKGVYNVSNFPKYEPFGEQICTNKIDDTNNKLDDLNQSITNDDVNGVQGAFESFEGFIAENSTITQLITMPITLYTSILNGMQSTCQPFVLGNLYGTNLTIPCINIGSYLGTSLWSMIDIIISGFAIFSISKKFIKIFNNFSSMKEGDVIDD